MRKAKAGRIPQIQPAFSGVPPRPPKRTARGLEGASPDDMHAIAAALGRSASSVAQASLERLKKELRK
jgi:hypothetical protein